MKKIVKLGWAGYASLLRQVQLGPKAFEDLVEFSGAGILMVRQVMNRLHDMGLVHIAGWEKRKYKGSPVRLWGFGPGQDVPHPTGAPPGRVRNKHARYAARPELVAFANFIRALAEPITMEELVEELGSTSCNMSKLTRHCRAIGLVRVAAWRTDRPGKPAMMFQISDGRRDAPRPKPLTRAQISARWREAQRNRRQMVDMIRATAGPAQVAAP